MILRAELDELAGRRGAEVHYVLGDSERRGAVARASCERWCPTSPQRDVYLCGSPAMTRATRASLAHSGVPRRQIVTERFAY